MVEHTRIIETTEETGYLQLDHLTKILGGTVVRTPGLDSAVVLSQRGDDFHLNRRRRQRFTFQVTEPDAAIALTS
jgi:uncharacterized linocin/CFP29 family protein